MKTCLSLLCLSMSWSLWAQIRYEPVKLRVDLSGPGTEFHNYWNGTGFTPGRRLLRRDMHLTLDYQSAVPHRGVRYVRPHWLLDLVRVRDPGTPQAVYSYDRLFEALDALDSRDLALIFEIMGFPQVEGADGEVAYDENAQGRKGRVRQWVPDFEREEDYRLWHAFVVDLVTALEKRYGTETLKGWYFESFNEPDVPEYFWKQGIPALLNYWDASSEAVKAVNAEFRFGGPGTAHVLSREFKAVLAHCASGTNAMTGERGAVLDFISVHAKNLPYDMIGMEDRAIDYIRERHPEFRDLPFWNNEADPTWGWRRPFWWRPRTWYAGFVVQSVNVHNRRMLDERDLRYEKLVNDYGFLGNWYHRTALARFSAPGDADGFWLIKKPVHSAMTLLAHTPGRRYRVEGYASERPATTALVSRNRPHQVVVLLANTPEFGPVRSGAESDRVITPEQKNRHDVSGAVVDLRLDGLGMERPAVSQVRMDAIHGNPYGAWREIGAPEAPTREEYAFLADRMEPVILERRRALEADRIRVRMPPSSIALFVITDEAEAPEEAEPEPEILSVTPYRGLHGERTEFVRWSAPREDVVAYHLYATHDDGSERRVTGAPVLDLGFLHVWPEGVEKVRYRVETVEL